MIQHVIVGMAFLNPINCPNGQLRKSLAIYYLCEPSENIDIRGKALFAPTEEQKSDKSVLDLIKKRSSVNTASSVYKKIRTSKII